MTTTINYILKMRPTKTDIFITEYCQSHGIKLLFDPDLAKNDGLCYPTYKEIHLAEKYTSSKIKLAVFLHECAHMMVERFKNKPYNSFECEFLAWQSAVKLHKKYFNRSFSKTQAEFMLKCLKSYCSLKSEFKRIKEEI